MSEKCKWWQMPVRESSEAGNIPKRKPVAASREWMTHGKKSMPALSPLAAAFAKARPVRD